MFYPGSKVSPRVRDQVTLGASAVLSVEQVVSTMAMLEDLGLSEGDGLGIMAVGGEFGRVYICISDEDLKFVGRPSDET